MGVSRIENIFLIRHGESEANVNPTIYQTKADHKMDNEPFHLVSSGYRGGELQVRDFKGI